jgi:hypothetical protein
MVGEGETNVWYGRAGSAFSWTTKSNELPDSSGQIGGGNRFFLVAVGEGVVCAEIAPQQTRQAGRQRNHKTKKAEGLP